MARGRHIGRWTLAWLLLGGATAWLLNAYRQRSRGRRPGREACDLEAVVAAFDRIARLPHMAALREMLVRRARSWVGKGRALDLGCGSGLLLRTMARRIPGLELCGLDVAAEMLGRSHDAAPTASLTLGSGAELPFRDSVYDLVTSSLSLHHWTDPVAVLREVRRVLVPGGVALILDLRRDMAPPAWMLLYAVTRCIVPRALRGINEPLGSRDAAYTPEEVEMLMRQAGWKTCRVLPNPLFMIIEAQRM